MSAAHERMKIITKMLAWSRSRVLETHPPTLPPSVHHIEATATTTRIPLEASIDPTDPSGIGAGPLRKNIDAIGSVRELQISASTEQAESKAFPLRLSLVSVSRRSKKDELHASAASGMMMDMIAIGSGQDETRTMPPRTRTQVIDQSTAGVKRKNQGLTTPGHLKLRRSWSRRLQIYPKHRR